MLSQSHVLRIEWRRLAAGEPAGILLDLLTYWDGKRRGRRFPAKADMRPEELKAYLGDLCILEVVGTPPGFRYRLVGSRLADATLFDATGYDPRDIPPRAYGEAVHQGLFEALEAAAPLLHEVTLQRFVTRLCYQRATLPLAGDGEAIDHLMTFSLRPDVFKQLYRRIDLIPTVTGE